MIEVVAKVRIGQDPLDVCVVVRRVLRDGDGRIVGKFGLSGATGEWLPVAERQAYPDECLLPVRVWRDEPGDLAVSELVNRE